MRGRTGPIQSTNVERWLLRYLVNTGHTQILRFSSEVGIDVVRKSAPTQKKKKKLISAYSYKTRGKEGKSENTPIPKFTFTPIGNLPAQLKLIPHLPKPPPLIRTPCSFFLFFRHSFARGCTRPCAPFFVCMRMTIESVSTRGGTLCCIIVWHGEVGWFD